MHKQSEYSIFFSLSLEYNCSIVVVFVVFVGVLAWLVVVLAKMTCEDVTLRYKFLACSKWFAFFYLILCGTGNYFLLLIFCVCSLFSVCEQPYKLEDAAEVMATEVHSSVWCGVSGSCCVRSFGNVLGFALA